MTTIADLKARADVVVAKIDSVINDSTWTVVYKHRRTGETRRDKFGARNRDEAYGKAHSLARFGEEVDEVRGG